MTTKYNIIYADPPWSYNAWNTKGKNKKKWGFASRHHYPTMTTKQICNLKVNNLSDDNAVLFLWATWPNLPTALEVMKAWGFTYKTVAFVWSKQNKKSDGPFLGLGHYTRGNTEMCLLGIKGKLKRRSAGVRQLVFSRIRKHSQKPVEVRDRIVELFGNLPRIELFASEKVVGWDAWGLEVEAPEGLEI